MKGSMLGRVLSSGLQKQTQSTTHSKIHCNEWTRNSRQYCEWMSMRIKLDTSNANYFRTKLFSNQVFVAKRFCSAPPQVEKSVMTQLQPKSQQIESTTPLSEKQIESNENDTTQDEEQDELEDDEVEEEDEEDEDEGEQPDPDDDAYFETDVPAEVFVRLVEDAGGVNNLWGHYGETPLIHAVLQGSYDGTAALIEMGADVNMKMANGQTPLHCAVLYPRIIELLIMAGAKVNAMNEKKELPIHLAVRHNRRKSVFHLAKAGSDINFADCEAVTALQSTVLRRRLEMFKIIVEHSKKKPDFKKLDASDFSIVHYAASYCDAEFITYFLHDRVQSKGEFVAAARERGNPRVLDYELLEYKNSQGCTPLFVAVTNCNVDTAGALVELGADINTTNVLGTSLVHNAVLVGNDEILAFLLRNNAPVDTPDINGYTPLMSAIQEGDDNGGLSLIRKGANIDAIAKDGNTPLHVAVTLGYGRWVKKLLELRAKFDVKNKMDQTPLEIAKETNKKNCIALLEAHISQFR